MFLRLVKVETKDVHLGLQDVDYATSVLTVAVDLCSTGWLL